MCTCVSKCVQKVQRYEIGPPQCNSPWWGWPPRLCHWAGWKNKCDCPCSGEYRRSPGSTPPARPCSHSSSRSSRSSSRRSLVVMMMYLSIPWLIDHKTWYRWGYPWPSWHAPNFGTESTHSISIAGRSSCRCCRTWRTRSPTSSSSRSSCRTIVRRSPWTFSQLQ